MNRVANRDASDIVLSISIAVQGAQSNLPDILNALPPTSGVEILICHAPDDPLPAQITQLLRSRADLRDGFLAARGEWVATLTAHCPPDVDWLSRALMLVKSEATEHHAAFGGVIIADPSADRVARAVHLLRYAGAGPGRAREQVYDLSADNAIYRHKAVMQCTDLLPDGFWEPSYHRRFFLSGMMMENIPDLIAIHRNRYSAAQFRLQRRRHGRVFGRHRSEVRPRWAQWAMLLVSPAAFPVFAFKQTRKVLLCPMLRSALPQAVAPFYGFMASWCLGEVCGYADALRRPSVGERR